MILPETSSRLDLGVRTVPSSPMILIRSSLAAARFVSASCISDVSLFTCFSGNSDMLAFLVCFGDIHLYIYQYIGVVSMFLLLFIFHKNYGCRLKIVV